MIVDILNEIYTIVKSTITTATVIKDYPTTSPVFPCIIIHQLSNYTDETSWSSSGEKINYQDIEIQIFVNSENKHADVLAFRKQIDSILGDTYHMRKNSDEAIANMMDESIYRWVMRYSYAIDSNKVIYGR